MPHCCVQGGCCIVITYRGVLYCHYVQGGCCIVIMYREGSLLSCPGRVLYYVILLCAGRVMYYVILYREGAVLHRSVMYKEVAVLCHYVQGGCCMMLLCCGGAVCHVQGWGGVLYCHCYMQGRAVLCHCVMCRGGAASPTVEVETAAPVDGDSDWAEDMPQEEEDSGGEDSVSCPPPRHCPFLPSSLPP